MSAVTPPKFAVSVQPITKGPKHHFFGYFDKCPWDPGGRFVLALEVQFMDRIPCEEDLATIGIIDTRSSNEFSGVGTTRAWNWQQGAMLQWRSPADNQEIIYNDRQEGRYVGVVMNIHKGTTRILPFATGACSHDGKYCLSLNFSRLYDLRQGYGYSGIPDAGRGIAIPQDEGIGIIDIENERHTRIISLPEIASWGRARPMEGFHYLNHLSFSPDDKRIAFFHLCVSGKDRYSRLFTANVDGSDVRCLHSGIVSHMDWASPTEILVWARSNAVVRDIKHSQLLGSKLRKLLKQIYKSSESLQSVNRQLAQDGFLLVADQHHPKKTLLINGEDGHCTYSPDRQWIIRDTYPDSRNFRRLILHRLDGNTDIPITEFFSPPHLFGHFRCDLHPRWSRDGKSICVDSAHDGTRQMYCLELEGIQTAGANN